MAAGQATSWGHGVDAGGMESHAAPWVADAAGAAEAQEMPRALLASSAWLFLQQAEDLWTATCFEQTVSQSEEPHVADSAWESTQQDAKA